MPQCPRLLPQGEELGASACDPRSRDWLAGSLHAGRPPSALDRQHNGGHELLGRARQSAGDACVAGVTNLTCSLTSRWTAQKVMFRQTIIRAALNHGVVAGGEIMRRASIAIAPSANAHACAATNEATPDMVSITFQGDPAKARRRRAILARGEIDASRRRLRRLAGWRRCCRRSTATASRSTRGAP
jgi:hypothetical protein